uniref:Uncharacterized protein n=1 Tax=Ciona intestinalis TaxID=7719 RepID=H2XVG7_CIOIN
MDDWGLGNPVMVRDMGLLVGAIPRIGMPGWKGVALVMWGD